MLCAVTLLGVAASAVVAAAEAPPATPPPGPAVAGYTVQRGDCRDANGDVCGTLMGKGAVPHKSMQDLAAVCNTTAGCEGFNSLGCELLPRNPAATC